MYILYKYNLKVHCVGLILPYIMILVCKYKSIHIYILYTISIIQRYHASMPIYIYICQIGKVVSKHAYIYIYL